MKADAPCGMKPVAANRRAANRTKIAGIVLLLSAIVCGGILIVHDYRALAELNLRAERASSERANADRIIAGRTRRNVEVDRMIAPDGRQKRVASTSEAEGTVLSKGLVNMLDSRVYFDPEYMKRFRVVIAGDIEKAFGPFFLEARLTEDERRRVIELLVEQRMTALDAEMLAKQSGMDLSAPANRKGFGRMLLELQSGLDKQLVAVLGKERFDEYSAFRRNAPVRHMVDRVSRRLDYTAEPLRKEQADRLTSVLASTPKGVESRKAIFDQARAFLTPGQFSALAEIDAEADLESRMSALTEPVFAPGQARIEPTVSDPKRPNPVP